MYNNVKRGIHMKKDRFIAIRIEKEIDDFLQKKADDNFTTKSAIIHSLIVREYNLEKNRASK